MTAGDSGRSGGDHDASEGADPVALVRMALGGDPRDGLPAVRRLRALIDQWEDAQVSLGRQAGMNWAEIARLLNRHRQAVHREYAGRERTSG